MKPNNIRSDELNKLFYGQTDSVEDETTLLYLWTGESCWCHYSHKVSEHKTISRSPFIASCSGGGGTCLCREFVPYRNISGKGE